MKCCKMQVLCIYRDQMCVALVNHKYSCFCNMSKDTGHGYAQVHVGNTHTLTMKNCLAELGS